jgi:tetratricopeptide (TPR) repeat protein
MILKKRMAPLPYAKNDQKPRLVFFQSKQDILPKFLQLHQQLHVKCLTENFEVISIKEDCDYKVVCDIYNPNITLFESGYKSTIPNKLIIKNTNTHPQIPKLGLHNGDGWCECRVNFFHDMEEWGIDTFFTISVTMAEYTPIEKEKLFVWPNFIDSEIYKDYHEEKTVPILFNGSMISLYPWRQKILETISKTYKHQVLPHLGYGSASSVMIFGAEYARKINSSWFVPACGTVAKEVVRKHFEVPACKACLIAERTPALQAAGFIDMENCIFADEHNVTAKLEYLFNNQVELLRIIENGYNLVQTRHTLKQRSQIFEWYSLNKNLAPNQKIIQPGLFEPLRLVEKSSNDINSHIVSNGLITILLKKGDEQLAMGEIDEAEKSYLACLQYISWMSEPKLKLAICNLFKGDVDKALEWIREPIHNSLGNFDSSEPDPIEWTYFIIALLCKGNIREASIRASQFPLIHHIELERIRAVIDIMQGLKPKSSFDSTKRQRNSIHRIQFLEQAFWIDRLIILLRRCNQHAQAELLLNIDSTNGSNVKNLFGLEKHLMPLYITFTQKLNDVFNVLHVPKRKTGMPSVYPSDYLIRLAKWTRLDALKLLFMKYRSHH